MQTILETTETHCSEAGEHEGNAYFGMYTQIRGYNCDSPVWCQCYVSHSCFIISLRMLYINNICPPPTSNTGSAELDEVVASSRVFTASCIELVTAVMFSFRLSAWRTLFNIAKLCFATVVISLVLQERRNVQNVFRVPQFFARYRLRCNPQDFPIRSGNYCHRWRVSAVLRSDSGYCF